MTILAPAPLLPPKLKRHSLRHSWGEPVRFEYKTERSCVNGCGIVKVTRHEGGEHWIEFWREGEKIATDKTPGCI
jgi:hypothetical protein